MFDNGADRAFARKFRDQFKRGVGVIYVVIRQLFALPLLGGGHAGAIRAIGIKRGLLMRIFAVAQSLRQGSGKGAAARCGQFQRARHPV